METHNPTTLNKVCNTSDWGSPEFLKWVKQLYPDEPLISDYKDPIRKHRKDWEFAVSLCVMERHGLLNRSSHALGVGSGHERILYFLTKHLREVIATDLYGHTSFSGDEADPAILKDMDRFAPFPYERDRLKFVVMNGTDLRFDDSSFDIVFSYSSIEHFGGILNSVKSIKEMARIVKPGGLVSIASEYLTPYGIEEGHPEFFSRKQIEEHFLNIEGLKPVTPFDWSCEKEKIHPLQASLKDRVFRKLAHLFRQYPEYPYTRISDSEYVWTSFHMAFIKES